MNFVAWEFSWNNSLDATPHQAGASIVPRDHDRAWLTQLLYLVEDVTDKMSVAGLRLRRSQYVRMATRDRGNVRLVFLAKLGFHINHPLRGVLLGEVDIDYVPLGTLPIRANACARNDGSSCFINSMLIAMFVATDRYDGVLRRGYVPSWLRATADEVSVLGDGTSITSSFRGLEGSLDPYNAISVLQSHLREYVYKTRLGDGGAATAAAGRFRAKLGEVNDEATLAVGQDDAIIVHDAVLSITGADPYFSYIGVDYRMYTSAFGVTLDRPMFISANVSVQRSIGVAAIGISGAVEDQHIDSFENTISITDYTALRTFVALGNRELNAKISEIMIGSLPRIQFWARSEGIAALPPGTVIPRYGGSMRDDLLVGDLIDLHERVMNATLVAVRRMIGSRPNTARVTTSTEIRAFSAAAIGTSLAHQVTFPSSGAVMLSAGDLRSSGISAGVRTSIAIPADRRIAVKIGYSGARVEVKLRISAVVFKTGDASSGHYQVYFWDKITDDMYHYDDIGPTLDKVLFADPVVSDNIQYFGTYFLAERT